MSTGGSSNGGLPSPPGISPLTRNRPTGARKPGKLALRVTNPTSSGSDDEAHTSRSKFSTRTNQPQAPQPHRSKSSPINTQPPEGVWAEAAAAHAGGGGGGPGSVQRGKTMYAGGSESYPTPTAHDLDASTSSMTYFDGGPGLGSYSGGGGSNNSSSPSPSSAVGPSETRPPLQSQNQHSHPPSSNAYNSQSSSYATTRPTGTSSSSSSSSSWSNLNLPLTSPLSPTNHNYYPPLTTSGPNSKPPTPPPKSPHHQPLSAPLPSSSPRPSLSSQVSLGLAGAATLSKSGFTSESDARRAATLRESAGLQVSSAPKRLPLGSVVLFVTVDGSTFHQADVSGTTSPEAIKEKVFTAVSIRDDDHDSFSLFRRRMGVASDSDTSKPLDGEALYAYCSEPGEIKGLIAIQTSVDGGSVPLVPPPSSSNSSPRTKQPHSGYGHPKSGSASSVSDQVTAEYFAGGGGFGASASETSVSEMDGSSTGPTTLQRVRARRQSSHLAQGGGALASPSSLTAGRRAAAAAAATKASGMRSPDDALRSPSASTSSSSNGNLAVDPSSFARRGSVTPTPQPTTPLITPIRSSNSLNEQLDRSERPTSYVSRHLTSFSSRPTSAASLEDIHESMRLFGGDSAEEANEELLRALEEEQRLEEQEKRDLDRMAAEWDAKDRQEEEERRRKQLAADAEAAMREQRREQDLYQAQLQREKLDRQEQEQQQLYALEQERHLVQRQISRARSGSVTGSSQPPPAIDEFGGDWRRTGSAGGGPNSIRTLPVRGGGGVSRNENEYRSASSMSHRTDSPYERPPQLSSTLDPTSRLHIQQSMNQQRSPGYSQQGNHYADASYQLSSQSFNSQREAPQQDPRRGSPAYSNPSSHHPSSSSRLPPSPVLSHDAPNAFSRPSLQSNQDPRRQQPQLGALSVPRTLQSMRSNPNMGDSRQAMNSRGGGGPNQPLLRAQQQQDLYSGQVQTGLRMGQSMGRGASGFGDQMYSNTVGRTRPAPPAMPSPSQFPSRQPHQHTISPPLIQTTFSPQHSQNAQWSNQQQLDYPSFDSTMRDPLPRNYSSLPSASGPRRGSSPSGLPYSVEAPRQFPPGGVARPRPSFDPRNGGTPRPRTHHDESEAASMGSLIPPRRPSSTHESPSSSPGGEYPPLGWGGDGRAYAQQQFQEQDLRSYQTMPSMGRRGSLGGEESNMAFSGHGRYRTEGASPPTTDLRRAATDVSTGPSPPPLPHTNSAPGSTDPSYDDGTLYGGTNAFSVGRASSVGTVSAAFQATRPPPPPPLQAAVVARVSDSPVSSTNFSVFEDFSRNQLAQGDDSSEDDSDDGGTNVLFRPAPKKKLLDITAPTPLTARPVTPSKSYSGDTERGTARTAEEDDPDATLRESARLAMLLISGNSNTSPESTLTTSSAVTPKPARLDNRSLPPIQTNTPSNPSIPSNPGETSTSSSSVHPNSSSSSWGDENAQAADDEEGAFEEEVLSARASGGGSAITPSQLVRKKTVFAQNADQQWAFRPPPDIVVKQLSKFFPHLNLDTEVIEAVAANANAIAVDGKAEEAKTATNSGTKLRYRTSIRRVAEERQRMSVMSSTSTSTRGGTLLPPAAEPAAKVSVVRRRSTKMWGSKVEEVKPGQLKKSAHIPVAVLEEGEEGKPATFKWVKGDLIGKGAYGRVYLGLNATTGEMIAVKQVEMPKTLSDQADDRQVHTIAALRSEIQLLKDLDHPNVVQYLGFEQSDDFISIFLEYVPGGSLGSVFRKYGKLQEGEVRWFSKQILEGLAYLHSLNILHRDLKGDNILVDPHTNGVCKITDFGISKQSSDAYKNDDGTLLQGSVFWMAPEVVNNQGRGYSAKVDIWSFGCVVLEMFSGERPWQGLEMMAIMFKLGLGNRPPIPDNLHLSTAALDFVNNKTFAILEAERPSAEEALKHEFFAQDPDWEWSRDSELARKVSLGGMAVGGRRRGR